MTRLLSLSCLACLLLTVACIDTSQPSMVVDCAKTNSCSNAGGSGGGGTTGTAGLGGNGGATGSGGATAGSGGATAGSGGATAGSTGGSSGGGVTGSGGGIAGSSGGAGGSGGGVDGSSGGRTDGGSGGGGSSGTGDGGSPSDAGKDVPIVGAETGIPSDTRPPGLDGQSDVADAPGPGIEVGRSDSGPAPDAPADLPRDLPVDITPDTTPPGPDVTPDAGNCIQKIQANGYSVATDASVPSCSACKTSGGDSLEKTCTDMVDCLQPVWPCNSGDRCWLDCRNNAHADSVEEACVMSLTAAGCSH